MTRWLLSTIGKRGYIADYLRQSAEKAGDTAWIIGTGTDRFTPGFADCDEAVLVPPYGSPDYGDRMIALASEYQVDAMLTFADPDAAALSTIRDDLESNGVKCFFPGSDAAAVGFDKLRTAQAAADLGVPTPRTTLPQDRQSLPWPRIWKPRTGSASSGVTVAGEPDHELRLSGDGMIVQERVDGEEIDVEVLCDLDSRVVRGSAWRKLKSRHGETEIAVTGSYPQLVDLSTRFAEGVGFVGPVDFDWIVTSDGPYLIEANTRFGGGYPVSHLAGAGFTDALVRLARGEPVIPDYLTQPNVFMMKRIVPFGGTLSNADAILSLQP